MEEVQPCKCGCGGKARINYTESYLAYVECQECLTATRFCRTAKEAILIWNKAMGAKDINVPDKYEYHIDHTDCIWYWNGKGKCPSTCSQYRDGWNDAMDYIFKNGAGYRPYKRGVNDERH